MIAFYGIVCWGGFIDCMGGGEGRGENIIDTCWRASLIVSDICL